MRTEPISKEIEIIALCERTETRIDNNGEGRGGYIKVECDSRRNEGKGGGESKPGYGEYKQANPSG